jgi:class 3 adenylate cyclase
MCPNCGAVNPPNARFCNQCGTPLPGAGSVPSPAPPQQAITIQFTDGSQPQRAQLSRDDRPVTAPRLETDTTDDHEEQDEQRRVVTVLFADLTSSTALAEAMDPEDERALLASFFDTMAREIHRHSGTIEKYIGDAVMAVFGLPVAHEDDPLRAVRAALDMQAALRGFNSERATDEPNCPELKMRIGVNTGEVAAAGMAAEGRDFLITGDPVNVAARLQALATPGSIVVGPRTYRSTSGAVEFRALPPATLRGKSRPVKIWEAVRIVDAGPAPLPRPRGIDGIRASLVGREVEVELLRAVSSRVMRERRPHLVTLLGVPGIGKTRLAHEFLAQAPGTAAAAGEMTLPARGVASLTNGAHNNNRASDANGVNGKNGTRQARTTTRRGGIALALRPAAGAKPLTLEGRCPPYGEGITYWPLAEMLRTYCDISAFQAHDAARARLLECVRTALNGAGRAENPEQIAAYLGHTIGIESVERLRALLPTDSQQMQEGLQRAWRVFFEALAARRGLVALVEDVHWADDAMLDLLESIAARASDAPLLILCTARPELLERRSEWGGGKRNYLTIGLEALGNGDMRRMTDELLPGAGVPETFRQRILEKAEGNPFFLEEIVHMLIDRGMLVCAEPVSSGWRVALEYERSSEIADPVIPDTVQGVLMARFDLLTPSERDVLQHAAVIGRYFWPSALRSLAPHLAGEGLDALLVSLREKGLIMVAQDARISLAPPTESIYTFNHNLTRDIVYSTIVRTRRAHEHARVAEWMEGMAEGREEELAGLLAQHYHQYYLQANLARARNSSRRQAVRAKVLRYLTLAGDQAALRQAALKADGYYSDAIALVEEEGDEADLAQLSELYSNRGDARWMTLRADEAWADYATALRHWVSYAALYRGGVADRSADTTSDDEAGASPAETRQDARQPTEAPGASATGPIDGEPTGLPADFAARGMRLYRMLVQLPARNPGYFRKSPPHETLLGYLQQGLRVADAAELCDTLEYAALLTAKAFLWWSWPERRGERELLDALRSAREAVRLAERLGDPREASQALDALGNIQSITTDLRGYLDSQSRRLQWAQRIDDPRELVDMHAEVSMARMMVGDYALATEHARTALALASAADADPLRLQALRPIVLASFEWDHWSDALAAGADLLAASAVVEVRHSNTHLWALLALAVIRARTGRREEAEALAQRVTAKICETCIGESPQFIEVMRGRVALARGATREARHIWLAAVESRSGRQALAALLAELAELAARSGDMQLYNRYGAQSLELGWRSGARKALAQSIRARSIVAISAGLWDDALTDLQNVLGRHRELGTAWEEARTRYVLAGLYRRRGAGGDPDLARTELARALELFERLRAVRDIARVRAALAGSDVRLP